jgi:hypothetical protein
MMKPRLAIAVVLATCGAAVCHAVISLPERPPSRRLGDLRLRGKFGFEPNVGQAGSAAQFVARGEDFTLALSYREIVLTYLEGFGDVDQWFREEEFRLKLLGAQAGQPAGLDPLPGKSTFASRTDVPNYERVAFQDVYPGVDLICSGTQKRLELTFVIHGTAKTDAIRLEWSGSWRTRVTPDGSLTLRTSLGEIRVKPPIMIDSFGGEQRAAPGRFTREGRHRAGFVMP